MIPDDLAATLHAIAAANTAGLCRYAEHRAAWVNEHERMTGLLDGPMTFGGAL